MMELIKSTLLCCFLGYPQFFLIEHLSYAMNFHMEPTNANKGHFKLSKHSQDLKPILSCKDINCQRVCLRRNTGAILSFEPVCWILMQQIFPSRCSQRTFESDFGVQKSPTEPQPDHFYYIYDNPILATYIRYFISMSMVSTGVSISDCGQLWEPKVSL